MAYKFKVTIEALKDEKTTADYAKSMVLVSSQNFKEKREFLENGSEVFSKVLPNKPTRD